MDYSDPYYVHQYYTLGGDIYVVVSSLSQEQNLSIVTIPVITGCGIRDLTQAQNVSIITPTRVRLSFLSSLTQVQNISSIGVSALFNIAIKSLSQLQNIFSSQDFYVSLNGKEFALIVDVVDNIVFLCETDGINGFDSILIQSDNFEVEMEGSSWAE